MIKVDITARHIDLSDEIREYAKSRFSKLEKFHLKVKEVRLVVDSDHGMPSLEVIADAKHTTFVVHVDHKDLRALIDRAVDKLTKQMRRYKEKLEDKKTGRIGKGGDNE